MAGPIMSGDEGMASGAALLEEGRTVLSTLRFGFGRQTRRRRRKRQDSQSHARNGVRNAKCLETPFFQFDHRSLFVKLKEWSFKTDRKSTRLNFSHQIISYAVFCLKKKNNQQHNTP